jgi:hypothetical protein
MSIPSSGSAIQVRLERDAGDTALSIIRQGTSPVWPVLLPLSQEGVPVLWQLECRRQTDRLLKTAAESPTAFRMFGAASPFSGGCRFQTVGEPADGVRMAVARHGGSYLSVTTMSAELPEAVQWLELLGLSDEFFFEQSRGGRMEIHTHGE